MKWFYDAQGNEVSTDDVRDATPQELMEEERRFTGTCPGCGGHVTPHQEHGACRWHSKAGSAEAEPPSQWVPWHPACREADKKATGYVGGGLLARESTKLIRAPRT